MDFQKKTGVEVWILIGKAIIVFMILKKNSKIN